MLSTYLYIKRHNVTGKLYFGKTIKEPSKYSGSGLHWVRHLKQHGRDVETLWYCLFHDQEELTKFALMCSEQWNIVKSDEWLNLTLENGLMGAIPGSKQSAEHVAKLVQKRLGRKWTIEQRNKIIASQCHLTRMQEAGRSSSNAIVKQQVICPFCKAEGSKLIMHRWHFENCKHK